ncbi:SpoIIE family protein phosphatase, partial [Desulfobacterales bacterium HSG17]|nr:SpoIIE family protein phosphatase [Desulfobacterales bacterium HSG17]
VIGQYGIWEARNSVGEMLGKKRFLEIIRTNHDLSVEQIKTMVIRELNEFTLEKGREDNITLTILKKV